MNSLKWILTGSALWLSTTAWSEPLDVEYASFYSHLNKLDDESLSALQFAFGFKHVHGDQLCTVRNAYIHTQKQQIPLQISSEQRFTLPSEKALKLAKAVVKIDLEEPSNQCDMSVQLETKPIFLKHEYSHSELLDLLNQYRAFFDEMGGMLSFMMPTAEGLIFHFANDQPEWMLKDIGKAQLEHNKLHIDDAWIATHKGLTLPTKPIRITAKTAS